MPVFITAIAMLSTSCTFGAQSDTIKLEYTFDSDEPISYVINHRQRMTQEMMGEVTHAIQSSSLVIDRELIEIQDDGTLVLSQRSKSYSFTENLKDEIFEFDSTNSAHDTLKSDHRVVAESESIGWDIEILMSPQGDVMGIHNADEISKLIQGVNGSEAQDELTDLLSTETMTADYGPFWNLLPEQAVGLGDVWERVYTVESEDFPFILSQKMTVKKITKTPGGKAVHIDIEGTINIDQAMLTDIPPFMKVTQNAYSGSFIFNTAFGTVTRFESTISLDIAGSPGEGMGDIKILSEMHLQYEMIKN